MANIGNLTDISNQGKAYKFVGNIETFAMKLKFGLIENLDKRSDKSPDYVIQARAPHGGVVDVGGAWVYEIKKQGVNQGKDIYSMSFDEPAELKCTAFPDDNGNYYIVKERPRAGAARPAETTTEDESVI